MTYRSAPPLGLISFALTTAMLAAPVGCSSATAVARYDDLRAAPLASGLELTNAAPVTTFYALIPSRVVPTILLAPCVGGSSCPQVPANGTVVQPWTEWDGADDHDYTLFWWRSRDDGHGASVADSVRRVRVTR